MKADEFEILVWHARCNRPVARIFTYTKKYYIDVAINISMGAEVREFVKEYAPGFTEIHGSPR